MRIFRFPGIPSHRIQLASLLLVSSAFSCKPKSFIPDSAVKVDSYDGNVDCNSLTVADYLRIGTGSGLDTWKPAGGNWTVWSDERAYREGIMKCYIQESRPEIAAALGFRPGQTPKLAWKWYEESPIGFVGIPYVVLKTVLDLKTDLAGQCDGAQKHPLCPLIDIWQPNYWASVAADPNTPADFKAQAQRLDNGGNIDHIGAGLNPDDYIDGKYDPSRARWPLPYGLVFQGGMPNYPGGSDYGYGYKDPEDDVTPFEEDIQTVQGSLMPIGTPPALPKSTANTATGRTIAKAAQALGSRLADINFSNESKIKALDAELKILGTKPAFMAQAAVAGIDKKVIEPLMEEIADRVGPKRSDGIYMDKLEGMGHSPGLDNVFFSCAACHVGRANINGKMKHMIGSPNTEIEGQYYSYLVMQTGAALIESGFDINSRGLIDPKGIKPNMKAIEALQKRIVEKALEHPETLYGPSPTQILRGKFMAQRIASDIFKSASFLIGSAIKTHFIYYGVAGNRAYDRWNQGGVAGNKRYRGWNETSSPVPNLMGNRIGQMDAFGMASGLVALHMKRPDHSFMKFAYRDDEKLWGDRPGQNPAFTGFPGFETSAPDLSSPIPTSGTVGADGSVQDSDVITAENRILNNVRAWAPPVPAPIDIKALTMSKDHKLANWDGNQGAGARTLASGTSATGDGRLTNVEIHEPLNPFINNLPPSPYPYDIDFDKAAKGKDIFEGRGKCASCHYPKNGTIYTPDQLGGVDPNRSLVNTSVSRNMLAALVLEGCVAFTKTHKVKDQTGNLVPNRFCMPASGTREERLADFFQDTPGRVMAGQNGYKADVLHGIWTQAPYLHNGSVPTLAHLLCPKTRPAKFIRGNVNYDASLVGFVWNRLPDERYSPNDVVLAKEYDTTQVSRSNRGHAFDGYSCPDNVQDIANSEAGDLLEYLKTL